MSKLVHLYILGIIFVLAIVGDASLNRAGAETPYQFVRYKPATDDECWARAGTVATWRELRSHLLNFDSFHSVYSFSVIEDNNAHYIELVDEKNQYIEEWVKVPCPPPQTGSSTGLYLGGGYAWNTSTTTITGPTDRKKIRQDPAQAIIVGRANFGPWFLTGQVTFAGTPNGSFSDVFPATPAFNTTATVSSGNVYGFNGDAGYTVWNADGWHVGIFGGYYSFNEELYGMFPGFAGEFPLLSDHWRAGEGGVSIDKVFTIGMEPFDFNVTVAGLYDNLRAGAFNGNGGGVRVNGTLSFPLGPVMGNIYAQYANLNASGSNTGVPLTFKDEVWTVGFGVTYKFGAPAAAASPAYPVKALPSK